MYCITKWTKAITDSGKDEFTGRFAKLKEICREELGRIPTFYDFRILDDDGIIYAYGKSTSNSTFAPLYKYSGYYGCTEIQYKNKETGRYETL